MYEYKDLWHNCERITNLLQQFLEILKLHTAVYSKPCCVGKPQFSPDKTIILRIGKAIQFVFLSCGNIFPHLNYEL